MMIRKTLTNSLAIVGGAAVAAALVMATLAPDEARAQKAVGTITAAVAACAPGFKQVNKDAKGSYMCVSEPIRCPNRPIGYVTAGQKYNPQTRRFEYVCGVPAK